jgi:hypothetical protein
VAFAAACGDDEVQRPDDRDDLAWLDTMSITPVASPLETGFVDEEDAPVEEEPQVTAPRRVSSSTASRSSTRASSSEPVYRAPARAPRTVTERHTVRDAAIGAGAGAVLGAVVAGRGNRTKGAIIGGAAGAVIGGVIGHTVDKKERVVYLAGPVLY